MAGNSGDTLDPLIEEYKRLSPATIIARKRDEILARLKFFEQVYNEHVDQWSGVYLNPYLLREAVESYFCDVYRLKFFRPVNFINEHKQAAYAMKWISRIRPIQMYEGAGPATSILMVNAYFALIAGFALLDIDYGAKDNEWWKTYITNTVYCLHYHSVSVESLSAEMCAIQMLDSEWKVKEKPDPEES